MYEENKMFVFRLIVGVTFIALAFGFPYFITHTDYIEVKAEYSQHDDWTDNCTAEFMRHPTAERVITEDQIIVKAGGKLENVLVVYKGDKSPIVIKEESIVSRTGIQITVITPNNISKFITQR